MKALLLLSVLLSGVLAITAAAVEAPEAVKVVEASEAVEAAPQELQENNQMEENEVEVVVPEDEDPEVVSAGEITSAGEGRFFSCPAGWTRFRSACYQVGSSGRSWDSAASYCNSQGASLASVHDVFEYNFLQDLTRRAGYSSAWLGGFYFQNRWRWVDNSPHNYNYWSGQNSVSSYPCIYLRTSGGWSNHVCSTGFTFICKRRTDSC